MMEQFDERKGFELLARQLVDNGELVRIWPLEGGVSARMSALEIRAADGRAEKVVVRRHGEADRASDPQVAVHEFALLRLVDAAGVRVPKPRYVDAGGEFLGQPSLVVEYVDGEPGPANVETTTFIKQLAETLARVHRIDTSGADVAFLRPRTLEQVQEAARSSNDDRVRSALIAVGSLPARNKPVLLHGDYWPGNTLWRHRELVAIIDWEDAAFGEPLADVANARLELLWAIGAEAMEAFTQRYANAMEEVDLTQLPYWDLWADLRLAGRVTDWGLDEAVENAMRNGHEAFVAQALKRIAGTESA